MPRMAISPEKAGKVRFHEEVRVKKIKAKGKNQPLSTLYDEEDDELEDSGEAEEESRYVYDSHSVGSDVGEEGESNASSDADATEGAGREAIDRFKDDLFAEEGDDNGPHSSTYRFTSF